MSSDRESREETAQALLDAVTRWAGSRSDVQALALVGSHARGAARPDSDVDLVLPCKEPRLYLEDTAWVDSFGTPERIEREDWGLIQSVRVWYADGPEVEFGIGPESWAADPPPPGTMEVLTGGVVVLMDRNGALTKLAARASGTEEPRPSR